MLVRRDRLPPLFQCLIDPGIDLPPVRCSVLFWRSFQVSKGQTPPLLRQFATAVRMRTDTHFCPAHHRPTAHRLYLQKLPVVLATEVLRQSTLLLHRQDALQLLCAALARHMGVFLLQRHDRKAAVKIGHELRQPRISTGLTADTLQAHLLDQSILQSLVSALDTPLRLRTMRLYPLNAQLLQRPRKLRLGITVGLGGIDPEDAVLVTVKRGGQPVAIDLALHGGHVTQRGFGIDKLQLHELAGSVINKDQQAARRGASFKPIMGRTVDLDEFAPPRPA